MDPQGSSPLSNSSKGQPFLRGKLGDIDAAATARIVAASGDIALIIDRDGVIRDMALSNEDMVRDGAGTWLDQRWSDTVTLDSRHKVDELLRDALSDGQTRWREVNQLTPTQNSMMMRYLALAAGQDGGVIAIGRDDRATATMQRRLMEAQQATERDYSRLRDAEFRYRLLLQMSGEAVVVVDSATKKIVEANPAAAMVIGDVKPKLVGEPFVKIFDAGSQDDAASLLIVAHSSTRANCAPAQLFIHKRPFSVSASLFRQDRATQYLIRLAPLEGRQVGGDFDLYLQSFLDRIPDALLITDDSLTILTVNASFLDLVLLPTRERAIGQSFSDFLGRAGLERNILVENLREYGSVRNFATVLRNQFNQPEDVEVSANSAPEGGEARFCFTIRVVRRGFGDSASNSIEPRRSVEQLTQLIGRVKLKELVRESSDIVERLCIEAALELTKNNRASAAELLGLSRQSLYSKLHRFGLGNLGENE